jgi:YidC/Oxa1 family membrane protein insertase
MVFLSQYIPNFGIVIIVLSLLVKVVFHPLTAASMKSMAAMQRIQPEVKKLQAKYKKDPQKMNQEVMELYKKHKVNPIGGCLPMIIQMPVLIALYQVFLHAIDLRQASFLLWINDLSSPDMLFEVAGFPIRALPLIMYGSAYLQQMMTPTDPRQRVTMHLMNIFLLFIFYSLPSGLVLYWTVTNLLTAAQQYLVKRGQTPMTEQTA